MTPLLQNALERDDSEIGTWNPKLLYTYTALLSVALSLMSFIPMSFIPLLLMH